jgi:hypothetical protein
MLLLWQPEPLWAQHPGYAQCAQMAHDQIKPKERHGRAKAYYEYYANCLASKGLRPGYGTFSSRYQQMQNDQYDSNLHLLLDDTDEQWDRQRDDELYMQQLQNEEDMRMEDQRWQEENQRQAEEEAQRQREEDQRYLEQQRR